MSRPGLAALGALALLLALGFLVQPFLARESPVVRTGPGPAVRCLSPQGDLPRSPTRFVWTPAPGATAYRLDVLGPRDRLLFSRTTPETTVDLPAGAVDWNIEAGAVWTVTPIVGATDGEPSDPAVFRIVSP